MSLHYLLDGSNIVHQMSMLIHRQREDQCRDLIRVITTRRLQGSLRNKVTIVYDGYPPSYGLNLSTQNVKIIFSCAISADERIQQIIDKAANKKNFIVVTNDRAIQYAVRAMGAKVLGVRDFLKRKARSGMRDGSDSSSSAAKEPGKNIPRSIQEQISSELEEIWIKKNLKRKKGQ